MKLCTKNYENPSIFVKVTVKKISGTFFLGHGVEQLTETQFTVSGELSTQSAKWTAKFQLSKSAAGLR